jgi:hypothetical protein
METGMIYAILIIIIGIIIAGMARGIVRWLEKYAETTETNWDDIIVTAIGTPSRRHRDTFPADGSQVEKIIIFVFVICWISYGGYLKPFVKDVMIYGSSLGLVPSDTWKIYPNADTRLISSDKNIE